MMQAATADEASVFDGPVNGLPALITDLRRHGYQTGIDQLLAAQHLFLIWRRQPPLSSETIDASLAALFSTSADELQRFRPLFQDWYNACQPDYQSENQ